MLQKIIQILKDVVRKKGQGVVWNGQVKPDQFEVELSSQDAPSLGVVMTDIVDALKRIEQAKEEKGDKDNCCFIKYPGFDVTVGNIRDGMGDSRQMTITGKALGASESKKTQKAIHEAEKAQANLVHMQTVIKKAIEDKGIKVWGIWAHLPEDAEKQSLDVFVSFQRWKFQFTLERSGNKYTVTNIRIPGNQDKDDFEWLVKEIKDIIKDVKIVDEPALQPANEIEGVNIVKENKKRLPLIERAAISFLKNCKKPTDTHMRKFCERNDFDVHEFESAVYKVQMGKEKSIKESKKPINEQEMMAAKQRLEKKALAVQRDQAMALGPMFRSMLTAKMKGDQTSSFYNSVQKWFAQVDDLKREVESFVKLEGLTEDTKSKGGMENLFADEFAELEKRKKDEQSNPQQDGEGPHGTGRKMKGLNPDCNKVEEVAEAIKTGDTVTYTDEFMKRVSGRTNKIGKVLHVQPLRHGTKTYVTVQWEDGSKSYDIQPEDIMVVEKDAPKKEQSDKFDLGEVSRKLESLMLKEYVDFMGDTEEAEEEGLPADLFTNKRILINYVKDIAKQNRLEREADLIVDNLYSMSIPDLQKLFTSDEDIVDYLINIRDEIPESVSEQVTVSIAESLFKAQNKPVLNNNRGYDEDGEYVSNVITPETPAECLCEALFKS